MLKELPIFITLNNNIKSRKKIKKELKMVNAKINEMSCRFIYIC